MAITYATNQEIRASYPQVDGNLPAIMSITTQSGVSSPLTSIDVSSTIGFPKSGTLTAPDSTNTFYDLEYSGVTEIHFLLVSGQESATKTYSSGTVFSVADYMLDNYRSLAKAIIDQKITSSHVSDDFKKMLEILYVFYLVCNSHHDPDVRSWGATVKESFNIEVQSIIAANPGRIRQTICKLVEESLSSDAISILKTGPNYDQ